MHLKYSHPQEVVQYPYEFNLKPLDQQEVPHLVHQLLSHSSEYLYPE